MRNRLIRIALSLFVLSIFSASYLVSPANAGKISSESSRNISELRKLLRQYGYDDDVTEADIKEQFAGEESNVQAFAAPNGCSTPKSLKGAASKWNELFKPACNKHDICYGPKSKKSRKSCDKTFRSNMNSICRKKYGSTSNPHSKTGDCIGTASIYYFFVRVGGKSHYKGKGSNV